MAGQWLQGSSSLVLLQQGRSGRDQQGYHRRHRASLTVPCAAQAQEPRPFAFDDEEHVDRDSDPLRPTTTRGLDTTTYDPYEYDPYDPLRPATTRRNVKSPMTYHDPYDPYDPQSCEATTRVIRPLYDPSTTPL